MLIGAEMVRDLERAKVDVLMWWQDGILRYVPLAALYDGNYYLFEKYALETFAPGCTSQRPERILRCAMSAYFTSV
jgi:CHAT domain-containing protein